MFIKKLLLGEWSLSMWLAWYHISIAPVGAVGYKIAYLAKNAHGIAAYGTDA